ncbi:D-aspartate oxidase [Gloeophyllum trabeum ATCC 11539]|uniref:D-aspartate oxidase n=1 Tax=Gloeophyllum trabeum (strain ATCC 11539 / FP-39264 / Madison 617) TaxID=670483 RepID=S7RH70_GLOTA|nr:D-aspartate oxidase [Gloeophyllum trabeum ATCC 11539]EPQ53595.1 D-aspartate oxidase [Gloeophyllum trabeum ATCC 11539]
MASESNKEVVVVGAGVIGLTTALKIQEKGGYHVTIIAETFPSDPKSIRYTSHWAGAHHVSSDGEDKLKAKVNQDTFKVMWEMSAPGGEAEGCFLRQTQTEYYCDKQPSPHPLEVMPDFCYLDEKNLEPDTVTGVQFTTVSIDTPIYLNYLLSRFLARGGSIVRGSIQHISQVVEGGARVFTGAKRAGASVDAVIVCAGIGARLLGGVEDKDVYPIRGQTVLLKAPWIRFGRTMSSKDGLWTYIIPRRSGDVIVGGIKVPNDWYPTPRPETTMDILTRGLALCPELAPQSIRDQREPTVDDLLPLVIEEGCGLRPARKGGIRLEVEWHASADGQGRRLPIVHNYGHGGDGFQASWGSASVALELLENALAQV